MTKLRMLQSELRKREIGQLLGNADELMDYAVNLAGDDDGKLDVFVDIVLHAIRTEQQNFARATDPLLQRFLR
ncbi:hypothetical protein DVS77_21480 [Mycolicibacterium moriokaense]|nr:hypothetical protein DVS77_21480 [Mycolicibacterium moriokaense]